MNPLEIVLIIIGIIIIIISCRLVDKSQKVSGQMLVQPFSFDQNISEEDKEKLMSELDHLLSDLSEEAIVRTDDILSKLSNEKIMAVSEYSDQVLEKINRNHEEVVFLYNMLNDKERELKAAVKEIDQSKKRVLGNLEATKNEATTSEDASDKSILNKKPVTQTSQVDPRSTMNEDQAASSLTNEVPESMNVNNNKQILLLYSRGKTVMEISKLLGLGQGEVKLVIDLYKSKK